MNAETNLALARKLCPKRRASAVSGGYSYWLDDEGRVTNTIPDLSSWEGMGLVIERMWELGYLSRLSTGWAKDNGPAYRWSFRLGEFDPDMSKPSRTTGGVGQATSLPQAACLAACDALGVEVNDGTE